MKSGEIDNFIMNFKIWIEEEASLNGRFPEIGPLPVNRGSETPASDEVKRTNLQPQVDAQEPKSAESDQISAIDSGLEHMDSTLPDGDDADLPKTNKFKSMWKQLRDEWERIKMSDDVAAEKDGLGTAQDDEYSTMMQQHPNMVPVGTDQGPHGPGTFGQG
jgi:hypothetical protein